MNPILCKINLFDRLLRFSDPILGNQLGEIYF